MNRSYSSWLGFGDVIGLFIQFPESNEPPKLNSEPQFIVPNNKVKIDELPIFEGSTITFYKNGISQGVAFQNIFQGLF